MSRAYTVIAVLVAFVAGCALGNSTRTVQATAPDIPPTLEKREFGYVLAWTSDDSVYISCYPEVIPDLLTTPDAWHPGVRVLRCSGSAK